MPLDKDQDRTRSFTRRTFVLGALNGVALSVLGFRLGWLQMVEGEKYRTLADNNRVNVKLTEPLRGLIFDRNGAAIALNEQNFRASIVPEQAEDIEASLDAFSRIIPLQAKDVEDVLARAKIQPGFMPIEILGNLDWDQVASVEVNLPDLPGISIDVGQRRAYPEKETTAHLLGYVGAVTRAEIENDPSPVLKLPGFRMGKTGIEKAFDDLLRGVAGTSRIEVNVAGRMVRELDVVSGTQGADISLTIDMGLQHKVYDALSREKSASAVVMDVDSGAVYALVSFPSFDPNKFSMGIPQELWDVLMSNEGFPLNNKAVMGQYPPGSTFKMMTALAGLESGLVDAKSRVYCPGHYDIGDHRFHCWKQGGHGSVNLVEALEQSCDTFFYHFSRDIGIDRIAATSRRFGYGSKLDTGLPEERRGSMPDRAWKMGRYGTKWEPGETVVHSIGQGYTLATPLQLAVMTARLVNGGKAVKPWLVEAINEATTANAVRAWPDMGLDKEFIALLKEGMDAVCNSPKGTARAVAIKEKGREMGGKTGTAQVKRITRQERLEGVMRQEDQPWKFRHHALFVGYAPVEKPRYAVAVVVEHGGGGSTSAAPIARDILVAAQDINPAGKKLVRPPKRNKPVI